MKMPVWKYNDKCYLGVNAQQVYRYVSGQSNESQDCEIERIEFNKDEPYIMDLTFYRYGAGEITK